MFLQEVILFYWYVVYMVIAGQFYCLDNWIPVDDAVFVPVACHGITLIITSMKCACSQFNYRAPNFLFTLFF